MSTRSLIVFAHCVGDFVPAGRLTLMEEGVTLKASTFSYGNRYLQRSQVIEIDPVGLSLKDKARVKGKLLIPPNGLVFFGGIRDASPDAWGRRVIEARHKAPANSLPESTYLLEAGSERVGALDVRDSLTAPAHLPRGSLHSLAYLMEAAERIEAGLEIPESLEGIFLAGSGLGGMRPKASVRDDKEILWLSKFSSRSDHVLDIPLIEYATLRLASLSGLNVPEVRLLSLQNKKALLIRRFDRQWAGTVKPIEQRLHLISALTLLACDEMDSPQKNYTDIAIAMRHHLATTVLATDIQELYARMIFNILVSNDDDHLRNHAFLWDPALPGWRLSPLYDVMPRASLAHERYLHLGVGPEGRLATLDNAYAARAAFGLKAEEVIPIVSRVYQVVREWKTHFESFGVSVEQMGRIAPAFRDLKEVATPDLQKKIKG